MGISESAGNYFTHDSRLNSFRKIYPISKRRASNASIKGLKSLKWPHKFLSVQDLANAGFFYAPTSDYPDNVACFLCHRALDGWEETDNPLTEHLRHSPECGWAITTTLEKNLDGDWGKANPQCSKLLEARKATFADKWPHEDKKSWKCHVKQMVEAGWKYTPTPESDDMVTCNYCALTLDNWGKNDKPSDKHYERSPDCPFFILTSSYKQSPRLECTNFKRTRASRVSGLSVQSNQTIGSFASCQEELPTEDCVILNASTSSRKMVNDKKSVFGKVRKTRAQKNIPTDLNKQKAQEELPIQVHEKVRLKKRKSEDSAFVNEDENTAPPPKRRTTRSQRSITVDNAVHPHVNLSSQSSSKSRSRKGTTSQKDSSSLALLTTASIPDDSDIDRALEADLNRSVSDDEVPEIDAAQNILNSEHAIFSISPLKVDDEILELELKAMEADVISKNSRCDKNSLDVTKTGVKNIDNIESQCSDVGSKTRESAKELENKISNHNSSAAIHKKKVRAATRNATRVLPTRKTRGSTMSSNNHNLSTAESQTAEEILHDSLNDLGDLKLFVPETLSTKSNDTVKGSDGKFGETQRLHEDSNSNSKNHKTNGPNKQKNEIREENEPRFNSSNPPVNMVPEGSPFYLEVAHAKEIKNNESSKKKSSLEDLSGKKLQAASMGNPSQIREATPLRDLILRKSISPIEINSSLKSPNSLSKAHTPIYERNNSQKSPSSDAENKPPSPKASNQPKNLATPPMIRKVIFKDASALRKSPHKNNIITGLKSDKPWTAVDVEKVIWKSPSTSSYCHHHYQQIDDDDDDDGDVNTVGSPGGLLDHALERMNQGDLTNSEKKMTVEEWIYFNAQLAEENLRSECERMVGNFEREGTRAIRALEGIECIE